MRKKSFTIRNVHCQNGNQTITTEKVSGLVSDNNTWGIHKDPRGNWKVTHLPSGFFVASMRTQWQAKLVVNKLSGHLWTVDYSHCPEELLDNTVKLAQYYAPNQDETYAIIDEIKHAKRPATTRISADDSDVLTTSIASIPCLVKVTHYSSIPAWSGNPQNCPSDLDFYGYTEIEYDIYDRKGYKADWLVAKLTDHDRERIEQEIISKANDREDYETAKAEALYDEYLEERHMNQRGRSN